MSGQPRPSAGQFREAKCRGHVGFGVCGVTMQKHDLTDTDLRGGQPAIALQLLQLQRGPRAPLLTAHSSVTSSDDKPSNLRPVEVNGRLQWTRN